MITFAEYERGGEDYYVKIDINSCPPRMKKDYERRNQNVEHGFVLCTRCDGTGNELYGMYRKCSACDGTGSKIAATVYVEWK